jgi:hypothetical protein
LISDQALADDAEVEAIQEPTDCLLGCSFNVVFSTVRLCLVGAAQVVLREPI